MQPSGNREIKEERIKKIIDAISELEYRKFLEEIEPCVSMLKERGYDIRELFEIAMHDELDEFLDKIKIKLSGIEKEVRGKITDEEMAYLASLLFFDRHFKMPVVISPLLYESLRSVGLIRDKSRNMRSWIAKEILENLKDKGLVKILLVNEDIEISYPRLKYLYTLSNGKFISEIENSEEYKKLKENIDIIEQDSRFRKVFKQYKKSINKSKFKNKNG